jgi:hypothetical protein
MINAHADINSVDLNRLKKKKKIEVNIKAEKCNVYLLCYTK